MSVAVGYTQIDGLTLSRVRLEDAKLAIRHAANGLLGDELFQVATVNVDFLAIARSDAVFRRALHGCSLAVADGTPLLWLSRLTKSSLPERVTGVDLTTWLLDGGLPSATLFLLGSTQEVLARAQARATAHGARVVGAVAPTRRALSSRESSARLVADVNASGADVLLVALGAPLQETWTARWRSELRVAVAIGVGSSLDVAAGVANRAPEPWQRLGLEWLYRLWREPARLWRRYLARDLPYLGALVIRTMLGRIVASRIAARKEAS